MKPATGNVPSFLGWGILLLLMAFPFLLSEIASMLLFRDAPLEARLAREYRLETLFGQIETGREAKDHFTALFKGFEQRIYEHPDPAQEWRRLLPGLKKGFPGMIEGILLDEAGRPVLELSDRKPPKQLSQRFFAGFSRLLSERRPLSSIEQGFIKSFLGPAISCESQLHNRVIQGRGLPHQHFVYLSKPCARGMFILFFRPDRPLQQLAFEHLTRKVNRANPDVRIRLARSGDSARAVLSSLGIGASRRRAEGIPTTFWKDLQKSPRGHRWYHETLIGRRIIAPSWWVIGTTAVAAPEKSVVSRVFRHSPWLIALLCVLLWVNPATLSGVHPLIGSVRFKMVVAVLYTTLVPLVVMGITARSFLLNRESVLRTRIHQQLEAALGDIDSSFSRHLEAICAKLSWFDRGGDPRGKMTLERFRREYKSLKTAYELDSTQVFNASGVVVFEYMSSEFPGMFDNQSMMFGKAARDVLKKINDPLGAITQKGGTEDQSRDISIFAEINLTQTALIPIQTPSSKMFLNALFLEDQHKVSHVILNLWDQRQLKTICLQRLLPVFSRTYRGWHLLAWENGMIDRPMPADSPFVRPTRSLRRLVSSPSRAFRHTIPGRSRTWLLSGVRGKTLDDHSFLAIASDQPVREELANLSWSIRFAMLLISGASLILGCFLARFFLQPMYQLTLGMEAIMAGNFRFRLPITSDDEIGLLGRHFNQAIENLRDLEVARTLQEQLFPEAPIRSGEWMLFGDCITASQVGGDYVDYAALPDEEWRFILGDVSGHGVGSSLVVAMAKAIMEHPDTPSEPGQILTQINGSFHSILKRKKMMSAVVGFFNPTTGLVRLTNAGQCYPVLVRDNVASFIEMKGYPLGTTKLWKPFSTTVQLTAGDMVVFYSDGLCESLDAVGEPIGFDRLLEALPTLRRNDSGATVRAIREWHDRLSPLSPPADDITILVLQHVASPLGSEEGPRA